MLETMLKPSQFNIWVDDKGRSAFYNTLYGSLTVCSSDEVPVIQQVLANPDCPTNAPEVVSILLNQKHLIDEGIDEMALIRKRKFRGVSDRNRLDVILMPTMECNFACTYCYERHPRSRMTRETERAVKSWLKREIPLHKLTLLSWFGGEPLIAFNQILSITSSARRVAAASGVDCLVHITTNGYLLNKDRIKKLTAAGVQNYQITLDGPPETHNKLRVLQSGNGTFDRIFANIVELARSPGEVKISLRVNFNNTNLHSIPSLLHILPADIRSRLRVVYEPIFGTPELSAIATIPTHEISTALADYYKLAEELGYDVTFGISGLRPGKLVYCYAERQHQVIINFNGDIHKCSVSEFDSHHRVGYLDREGILRKEESWNTWVEASPSFENICLTCAYLPLCMGGCKRTRLQNKNTGSVCALIPTNASNLLKQIAFGTIKNTISARAFCPAGLQKGDHHGDSDCAPRGRTSASAG